MQILSQFIKENNRHEKENYRPVSIIPVCPKYSNVVFITKFIKTLAIHCLDIRWSTERDTAFNIH